MLAWYRNPPEHVERSKSSDLLPNHLANSCASPCVARARCEVEKVKTQSLFCFVPCFVFHNAMQVQTETAHDQYICNTYVIDMLQRLSYIFSVISVTCLPKRFPPVDSSEPKAPCTNGMPLSAIVLVCSEYQCFKSVSNVSRSNPTQNKVLNNR